MDTNQSSAEAPPPPGSQLKSDSKWPSLTVSILALVVSLLTFYRGGREIDRARELQFDSYLKQAEWNLGDGTTGSGVTPDLAKTDDERARIRIAAEALRTAKEHAEPSDESRVLRVEGLLAFRKGLNERAIELLRKATLKNSSLWEAQASLGFVYHLSGDAAKARAAYTEALRLNPEHAETHYNLGILHLDLEEYHEAKKALGDAAKWDPTDAEAVFQLASADLYLDNLPAAVEGYTKALELDPRHNRALFNRALCYQILKRDRLALEDLRRALDLAPSDTKTLRELEELKARLAAQGN
jgi:tetratricopeptide (TPR) repeat protein